jgi:hypothetical protein
VDDLTAIPSTITAGDSVAVTLSLSDYPATSGWAVTWALAGQNVLSVTSTVSGADHLLSLTTAQTSALEAGVVRWSLRVTKGAIATTIQTGSLTVMADVAALAPGAGVSYWETLKAAAESALLTLLEGGGVQMITILGRQTMFRSPDDCLKMIGVCEARIAAATSGTFGTALRFDVVGMR